MTKNFMKINSEVLISEKMMKEVLFVQTTRNLSNLKK